MKHGILYADVSMWPGSANVPGVEVNGNEFVVRPAGWDRNSSKNALEVVNENGSPVFQMVRLTPSMMRINGIFPLQGGGWPQGSIFVADENQFEVITPGNQIPADFKLTPIFKYPAWKFPGKYADSSN